LEVGDGFSELLAVGNIVQREVEGTLGDPDGLCADGDARVVEGAQCELQAGAGGTRSSCRRVSARCRTAAHGWGAFDAELAFLLPKGEAGVGLLDDEGADPLAARRLVSVTASTV
jgi:hypothetical protein